MDDILGKVFASKVAKLVASQPETDSVPALVATTQLALQDAGTIILDPTARKETEGKKKEKENKEGGKEAATKKSMGKGKEKKMFTFSPPLTRARKRMRQTSSEIRTLSQDSCTERNPTTMTNDNSTATIDNSKDTGQRQRHDKSGYTPPPAHYIPRMVRFHNGQMELDFIKKLLKIHDQPEH